MSTCKNCNKAFEITSRDLEYYKKINLPSPTHCPSCRQQRRYAIRNERNLYKRKCDLCGKNILAMYSKDKPFPVYCPECWWGDKWDAEKFSQEFDFSKPFFEQFRELQNKVPRISLLYMNTENCDYCGFVGDCKNCYLIFGSVYSEDCMYGSPYYSKSCLDNLVTRECELCYECTDCRKLYNSFYCQDCFASDNLLFCYDLQGCSECISCAGLRNQKYCIENKKYPEEDYRKIKKKINLCNKKQLNFMKEKFEQVKLTSPRHYMPSKNAENATGSHIYNSKNTFSSFFADKCEDCSYCMQVVDLKDCYDNNYTEENELCCEYLGMYSTKNTFFSTFCRHTYNIFYSEYCVNAKNLFGCSGIRNNDFCILNKQYTKEEYKRLVPKIIEHMKKTGKWGEFFPIPLSPFSYNETVAQEYFHLTKEKALEKNYIWHEKDPREYQKQTCVIKEEILEVPETITNEILACDECGKNYKIVPQELAFYKRMHLPIPSLCPDCRHKARLALRNERELFDRKCSKCTSDIKTTYSPLRKEKIYCEKCYLEMMY